MKSHVKICANHIRKIFKIASLCVLSFPGAARADMSESDVFLNQKFLSEVAKTFSFFAPLQQSTNIVAMRRIVDFCEKIDVSYKKFHWGKSPCLDLPWRFTRVSEMGEPLIFWEYRSQNLSDLLADERQGTTLILGNVHPDEITPLHLAFRLAQELYKNPQIYEGQRVVIAPVVNPDGLFRRKPTRTNINGVDLNRNFPTSDWWDDALKHWAQKRHNDRRHFPGNSPRSEEGTRFQMDLLEAYEPDKVISIHAPLGFLDYDGPGDVRNKHSTDKHARELVFTMARDSRNYKVRGFPIYPGSLGNYSGNERAIPTVTLELRSSDPRLANKFWADFYPGLKAAIRFDFKRKILAQLDEQCRFSFCWKAPTDLQQQGEEK